MQDGNRCYNEDDSVIMGSLLPPVVSLFNILAEVENERVSAGVLFRSLCRSESLENIVPVLLNRTVNTFSTVIKSFEAVNVVFCQIQPRKGIQSNFPVTAIACASLLALIDQYDFHDGPSDLFSSASEFAQKKFPDFNIALTLVVMKASGSISIYGGGKGCVIVKPRSRSCFCVDIKGSYIGDTKKCPEPENLAFSTDAMIYVCSPVNKNAAMSCLDHVANFNVAKRFFAEDRNYCGALLCYTKENNMEEPDALKKIEL